MGDGTEHTAPSALAELTAIVSSIEGPGDRSSREVSLGRMVKIATAIARGGVAEVVRALHAAVEGQLGPERPALVVAFASTDQPLGELLPALAGGLRGAKVLGASTAGEFTESEEGTGATSVFAV